MAQFKVGDKVRVNCTTSVFHKYNGVIEELGSESDFLVRVWNGSGCWLNKQYIEPADAPPPTIAITATLTTDTIPTDMLKQLSAAGFLITIKTI